MRYLATWFVGNIAYISLSLLSLPYSKIVL